MMNESKTTCRRCGDCRDMTHHWLDNPDFGNDDPDPDFLSDDEPSPRTDVSHICKHCPAAGNECEDCEGSGEMVNEHDCGYECPTCKGEGVVEVPVAG